METDSRNPPTARKLQLRRIAGALLIGAMMVVAAGAADAKGGGGNGGGGGGGDGGKDGGKGGGGGKGGSDNFYGHDEIFHELVKFSDQPHQPRFGGRDDDDDTLMGPVFPKTSPKVRHLSNRDAYCHAKYQSYNSITGKYTAYSGRQRTCVVP